MTILGIETSCDETAVAICRNSTILSSIISSQKVHIEFGGVVPEVASREHELLLNSLVEEALAKASLELVDMNGIAVTQGPGLAGTLLTGVMFAKGLALGLQIPIVGVNHLEAHIFANFLADPSLQYPFVCLLVSGGHTQLWTIEAMGKYTLLGQTRDDAAGEAFDKGARILGLNYPGGPAIQALAKSGNPRSVNFPKSFLKPGNFEFSFSGLKTSLLYFMDGNAGDDHVSKADVAASYQQAIIDVLTYKLHQAVQSFGADTAVVAGGVAANSALRLSLKEHLVGTRIVYPDLEYCTDNAAMVSYLGELKVAQGYISEVDFDIIPNMKLV